MTGRAIQDCAHRVRVHRSVTKTRTQRSARIESRSPVRVLVAEDFVPYRRFTCSTLANLCGLQIVGEVSDGLEAIQKAVELRLDLIVLDIGLLCLNGIETARQIRKLVPDSKIIFLAQESYSDVVQVVCLSFARLCLPPVGISYTDTMWPIETIEAFDLFLRDRRLRFDGVVIGGTALSLLGIVLQRMSTFWFR